MIKKLLTIMFLVCAMTAQADNKQPIKIIVPFPVGGSTDIIARIIADGMSKELDQPVVVETRAGAAGTIATKEVAKAPADGTVLVVATAGTSGTVHVSMRTPGFHPVNDFEHVATIASTPRMLVVRSDFPANSVQELVNVLKARPNYYIFGTTDEIFVSVFSKKSNTQSIYVPYRGGAPALVDLVGGHTHIQNDNLPLFLPYIKDSRIKALALAWPQRLPEFPNIPTFAELGYNDVNGNTWQALWAPKGTPKEVVNRLNRAVIATLKDPKIMQKIQQSGFYPVGDSPEQSKKLASDTYHTTVDIGRRLNITAKD